MDYPNLESGYVSPPPRDARTKFRQHLETLRAAPPLSVELLKDKFLVSSAKWLVFTDKRGKVGIQPNNVVGTHNMNRAIADGGQKVGGGVVRGVSRKAIYNQFQQEGAKS